MATQTVRVRLDDASIDSSVTLSQILLHRVTAPPSRVDPPESIRGSDSQQQQSGEDDEPPPPLPDQSQRHQQQNLSPSAIFGQEIAYSKRSVSSEVTQHRFWLPADLKIPIRVMQEANVYVGSILHTTPSTIFVEEDMEGCVLLPLYIADLPLYTENESRILFRQMCEAVQILHNYNCLHRNIHLNNVIADRRGNVLLRGFHHSIMMQEYRNDNYYTNIPLSENRQKYDWFAFRAPELDIESGDDDAGSNEHGAGVDVWSLGVCLYIMLTGLPPFRGTGRELRRQKKRGKIADYDMVVPSLAVQDLLQRMLTVRPKKRISLQQVLQHEWLHTNDEDDTSTGNDSHFSSTSFYHAFFSNRDLSLTQVFLHDWGNRTEECLEKATKRSPTTTQSHGRNTSDQPPNPQRPASPSGILLS